jgi:hypothetical protein
MDCLDRKKDQGMREAHLRNRESSERVQKEKVSYGILCLRNKEYPIIFFFVFFLIFNALINLFFFFFNGGQL